MISPIKLARRILPLLAFGVIAADGVGAQTAAPLTVKVYNAEAGSFHVNAIVVSGKTEALVIDTGFTRADALRVAANVLDSGKTLKTIFISNADPDFHFGAETLKGLFPQAVHHQIRSASPLRCSMQSRKPLKVLESAVLPTSTT
jgi:glyoxylase-like metal-dependent hydrolase (beta-lactamase superfamily II)